MIRTKVEPFFHEDFYGYRPKKSAIQALEITRKRCWKYNWVLVFDIKGLFDNINYDLLMRAVEKHQKVRDWKLQLKAEKELIDLSKMFNSVIQGWINYYGKSYKSEMYSSLRHINKALIIWARRKYKRLARHKKKAEHFFGRIAKQNPKLFKHWDIGIQPMAE